MELRLVAAREGRLSSFLREELNMSSGLLNRSKWGSGIKVNGVPRWTNFQVCCGDVITVELEEAEPDYPAEEGALTVLYEDASLLAVDKPAGMLIHPSRSKNSGTLANLVYGYYQKTGQKCVFHPLTRLDRDTFGIVLLAKNAHIHKLLQETVTQKTYYALTLGGPQEDRGIIDAPIGRKPLPSLLREITPEGKPSVTEFEVLARRGNYTKLALRPVTGRTHQLRLHCAHMGFPILGDPQYGSPESIALSEGLGLAGQQLCAKEITLHHPVTGAELRLQSKMDVMELDGCSAVAETELSGTDIKNQSFF